MWVWLVPTLWLLLSVLGALLNPGMRYSTKNAWPVAVGPRPRLDAVLSGLGLCDCSESECLGLIMFTIPFLSSAAYSIGAWLAFRKKGGVIKSADAAGEE